MLLAMLFKYIRSSIAGSLPFLKLILYKIGEFPLISGDITFSGIFPEIGGDYKAITGALSI